VKYQTISIAHFRGIEHVALHGLKQVNLIVGKNNSGKTSLLEAFFLLAGMSDPRLAIAINQFRDLSLNADSDFKYIFNKLDFTVPIQFAGTIDGTTRCATFAPLYEATRKIKIREDKTDEEIALSRTNQNVDGLQITFRTSENPEETSTLSIKNETISVSESYKEQLDCKYLHIKTRLDQMPKDISNIIIKKRMDTIVQVLREIEPNLIDIRMGNNENIYFDIGADELVPINIMGDGIRRTLSVLSSIYEMEHGILLIDEIENGLHYSCLKIFWKAILTAAKLFDVQIIATTHSYECIEALVSVETENCISLYRTEKKNNKVKTVHIDAETLLTSLKENYEVR
jgi:ATPase-like protein